MTSAQLFVALLHRLRRYEDALVVHALLRQHADQEEFKSSATRIARDLLGGQVTGKQVRRALARLEHAGLVSSRVYQNYRTCITVHRDALLVLLQAPVSGRTSSIYTGTFPFLDQWARTMDGSLASVAGEPGDRSIEAERQGEHE